MTLATDKQLADICWYKASVTLKSSGQGEQRAHQLFIFQAIINYACKQVGLDRKSFIVPYRGMGEKPSPLGEDFSRFPVLWIIIGKAPIQFIL